MSLNTSPTKADPIYDPLFHTPQDSLYDIYAQMRRDYPLYYSESRRVWCLTRHQDVQSVARDWRRFPTAPGVEIDVRNILGPGNFLDADPPRHDVLRNVVRPFFVPKAIAGLREDVERRVRTIVADLREHSTADLASEFAWRLPIWVISRLLGAPETDDNLIQSLVRDAEGRIPGDESVPPQAMAALQELRSYLVELARHKRRYPDGKVLTAMVNGQANGAPTAAELAGMALIFFIAGTETTVALLGNALKLLSEAPELADAWRRTESDDLIDATVEEVVRFDAPVQYLARTVGMPVTLHGVELPEGDRLILLYGAANRDESRWERPDEFDPRRKALRHLGFGEGIHFCVGAPLARLEARAALPAFVRAFSDFEITEHQRMSSHIVRGWAKLETSLIAAA